MKKIYLVLLAVLGMTVTSCLMEEKELFDKTPAERMEAYLDEYHELLASSEGGWLLQYYAEENQSYGGYAYVLKFTTADVTAWFQLAEDVATPVTSLYKMTPDDGPVLAFDMYNEYLHFFATPDVSNYEALHGDYEFRIVGKSEDASEVYLKGRRTGNSLKLVKFSGDPVEYLNACVSIDEAMSAPAYEVAVEGVANVASKSNNYLEFTYSVGEGESAVAEAIAISFCYTQEGVDFYAPVEIAGQTYTGLIYNAEAGVLASEDGKVVVTPVFPPLNKQFVDGDWMIYLEGCSTQAANDFQKGFNAVGAKGYPFNLAFLGDAYYGIWGFNVNFAGYGGVLEYATELIGEDKVKLTFTGSAGGNGATFYNWGLSSSLKPLGTSAAGKTFTLTADNPKSPTIIMMTDDADPDNVIAVVY